MFKKILIILFLAVFSMNAFSDYKIIIGSEKIKLPEQKGLSGQIENGSAYSINSKTKAIFYSELVGKMVAATDLYHLGYADESWYTIWSLDNDETGAKTILKSEKLNHGNDNPGRISHLTEKDDGIYMSIIGTNDRVYPYKIYPSLSGSATGSYSDYYTFYTKNNNSFVLVDADGFSNIYYSNGTTETSDPKFSYASYNKESDVVAMYGYPYVRAVKTNGEKLWDKHIYNDLNLNQNPALAVIGNGVLVQYGSLVKKIDFSGNISDFIDFSETDYPSSTIKGSYFNPKNNKLYFFSGGNKIGIMK